MNRKKIFGIIGGAVAIAAVAGVAINNANSAPKMSDLMTKNLEALSQYEIDPIEVSCSRNPTGSGQCWKVYSVYPHLCEYSGVTSDHCTSY